MGKVEYKNVKGHVEAYEDGEFIFSENNQTQARREYNNGFCSHLGGYCSNGDHCECCDFIQAVLIGVEY